MTCFAVAVVAINCCRWHCHQPPKSPSPGIRFSPPLHKALHLHLHKPWPAMQSAGAACVILWGAPSPTSESLPLPLHQAGCSALPDLLAAQRLHVLVLSFTCVVCRGTSPSHLRALCSCHNLPSHLSTGPGSQSALLPIVPWGCCDRAAHSAVPSQAAWGWPAAAQWRFADCQVRRLALTGSLSWLAWVTRGPVQLGMADVCGHPTAALQLFADFKKHGVVHGAQMPAYMGTAPRPWLLCWAR